MAERGRAYDIYYQHHILHLLSEEDRSDNEALPGAQKQVPGGGGGGRAFRGLCCSIMRDFGRWPVQVGRPKFQLHIYMYVYVWIYIGIYMHFLWKMSLTFKV